MEPHLFGLQYYVFDSITNLIRKALQNVDKTGVYVGNEGENVELPIFVK